MGQNLVLGFCANYTMKQVEPFLASLRKSEENAHICLYTANMADGFEELAVGLGVERKPADPYLSPQFHPQSARFFMYRDYLTSYGQQFTNVLLTDIRDVIFQGEFFKLPMTNDVEFASEARDLRDEPYNSRWIREFYGEDILSDIGTKRISCSGTTIGTLSGITRYVELMCKEITVRTEGRITPHDQGFHNYILWCLQPEFVSLLSSDDKIATVGLLPTDSSVVKAIAGSVIVDGVRPRIVHQYDRHQNIVKLVESSDWFKA